MSYTEERVSERLICFEIGHWGIHEDVVVKVKKDLIMTDHMRDTIAPQKEKAFIV